MDKVFLVRPMSSLVRKWKAVFGIFIQDGIAYRASGIIWIMTDLVTAVTMPLVWAKAGSLSGGSLGGFQVRDFVLYYLCLLFLGNFITSHIMWDLATEIKEGNFTTWLIKPISYYQATFFRNLAWRIIRLCLFLPLFFVLLFAYRGYLAGAHVFVDWRFILSVVLGHLVSFTFAMLMTMLAFYTQEVYSIFELYYVPLMFLSGQLFPISVLPAWAANLAKLFPFYFTTGAPTEILIGRISGDAVYQTLAIQLAWVTVSYCGSKILWAKGLKHYTAVGM